MSISDYFAKMNGITNHLFVVGFEISDEHVIMPILAGFPMKYDVIVSRAPHSDPSHHDQGKLHCDPRTRTPLYEATSKPGDLKHKAQNDETKPRGPN